MKEDAYPIRSLPKIRLRRAAANEKKSKPPESRVQVPHSKLATSDNAEVTAAVPDA